jgi:hypothetical protein
VIVLFVSWVLFEVAMPTASYTELATVLLLTVALATSPG